MSLTLTLTTEQAITLLEQLPPRKRREVLIRLSEQAHAGHEEQMRCGESDDIVHEDRKCSPKPQPR